MSFRSLYIDRDIRLVYVAQLMSGHLGPFVDPAQLQLEPCSFSCAHRGILFVNADVCRD